MTTIATDGRSMAADSQVTAGSEITAFTEKVARCKDGRVFAACGPTMNALKFRRWMLDGGDRPTLDDEFSALILNPDGSVDFVDKHLEPFPYRVPAAIGSGGEFAVGAMMAGASPKEAVAFAIDRDAHSGGEIIDLHLITEIRDAA
jgi:ATP-dependent protease HslVU (ClpYQ) peptidase subunit